MECPKCGSDKTIVIEMSYPEGYECKECGHVFLKAPKALIDE
ncbi:MAG TPA: transposase [archaeon]|nr:transposase [archaeon]